METGATPSDRADDRRAAPNDHAAIPRSRRMLAVRSCVSGPDGPV
ncbi:hypothetical protein NJ7G_0846 [Natrinema sp. J7-2]|nr:hypothetical protein NJ7G_0846 [Natrinema sp. J7-2]